MKIPKLHPGIKNPKYWKKSDKPRNRIPTAIRKEVLERDNNTCQFCGHQAFKWMNLHHIDSSESNVPENLITCCVACHSIFHIGRNLILKPILTIWESELSQVEIIQQTRIGLLEGKTQDEIITELPISVGNHDPDSPLWAYELSKQENSEPIIFLEDNCKAVFINLKRWQIDDDIDMSILSKIKF